MRVKINKNKMQSDFEDSFLSSDKDVSVAARLSASWIKENMLGSPPERRLTDAEVRVIRAIQRLDIPDWYLNKKSKAPKILKHDTPLDYRQPSWRKGVKPEIKPTKPGSSSDPTGIYSTRKILKPSVDESVLSGRRMFQDSIQETSLSETNEITETDESKMENSLSKQNETYIISSRAPFSANKSGTFPKISPSRKIENINIVIPSTSNSPIPKLPKLSPPSLPLETSLDDILSEDEKFYTPKRGTKLDSTYTFTTSLANAISPKPFSKKVGTPFATPASNFNIRAPSTSNGTEQTLFNSALDKITPAPKTPTVSVKPKRLLEISPNSNSGKSNSERNHTKDKRPERGLKISPKSNSEPKKVAYVLGELKPSGPNGHEICKKCGKKPQRVFAALAVSNPKNLKSLPDNTPTSTKFVNIRKPDSFIEEQREGAAASHLTKFTNEEKKSIEPEDISKAKEPQHGKNLVQEVIQEFRSRCAIKAKASPDSKNFFNRFFNRFVNDLQSGRVSRVPGIRTNREAEAEISVVQSGSRRINDPALNSTQLSTSISLNDLESGNHHPIVTSTLKSDVAKLNKKPNRIDPKPHEDDRVFWNPVKLRSLKEVKSTSKSSGSPIFGLNNHQSSDRIHYLRNERYQDLYSHRHSDRPSLKSLEIPSESGVSLSGASWAEDCDSSSTESKISVPLKKDWIFQGKKGGTNTNLLSMWEQTNKSDHRR